MSKKLGKLYTDVEKIFETNNPLRNLINQETKNRFKIFVMSFTTSADALRITHLSTRNKELDARSVLKDGFASLLKVLCGFGGVGGSVGGIPMILYNSFLLIMAFVCLFSMFPEHRNFQTRTMIQKYGPTEEWDNVHDFNSFWTFYESFVLKSFDSITDINNIPSWDPRSGGFQSTPLVWSSLTLMQIRKPKSDVCAKLSQMTNPDAKEQYKNALRFQNTDCSTINSGSKFGKVYKVKNDENGTETFRGLVDCPYFPKVHSPSALNPFLPFESGMKGYQTMVLPDSRAGMYAFIVSNTVMMVQSTKLQDCHWIDTRTTDIVVSGMYLNVATQELGESTYRVSFDASGAVSKSTSFGIVSISDPERDFPGDEHFNVFDKELWNENLNIVLVMLTIIHKAFTNTIKLVARIVQCCYAKKKRKKTQSNVETSTSSRFSMSVFLAVKCELITVVIAFVLIFFFQKFKLLKGELRNVLAHLGSFGWTRVEAMNMPFSIDPVTFKGTVEGMTDAQMFDYQQNLDVLDVVSRNLSEKQQNFKSMIALFMINASIDMIRHFYANPNFSIVPKTLMYSAKKLTFLIVVIVNFMCGYGSLLVIKYSSYTDAFASLQSAFFVLWNSMLGDLDYYEDIMTALPKEERTFFFANHIVWSLLVLIVTFNITVTVIMDAYSAAKDIEDKRAASIHAMNDGQHIKKRLNQERWKSAQKRTVMEIQEIARKRKKESQEKENNSRGSSTRSSLTAVVPESMNSPVNSPVSSAVPVNNWMDIDDDMMNEMNAQEDEE